MPGRITELLAVALALATLAAAAHQTPRSGTCVRAAVDGPRLTVTARDVEEVLRNE